jgi:hypothetical protein
MGCQNLTFTFTADEKKLFFFGNKKKDITFAARSKERIRVLREAVARLKRVAVRQEANKEAEGVQRKRNQRSRREKAESESSEPETEEKNNQQARKKIKIYFLEMRKEFLPLQSQNKREQKQNDESEKRAEKRNEARVKNKNNQEQFEVDQTRRLKVTRVTENR